MATARYEVRSRGRVRPIPQRFKGHMHDIRESSFEVRFDSASRRRVAHIRAWDAEEAAELFEAELRADGVEEEGEVVVSPVLDGAPSGEALRTHHAA